MVAELHSRRVVRVPDIMGHTLEKAKIIIEGAGLEVEAVLFRESYEDRDTILEQKPTRGQMVYEGSPITLWVARRGYMQHLPAIYRRSDAVGRNVVRDICFLFEHMFGDIGELLDNGHIFYDPHECPPEFLHWLASWTAMVVDIDWPQPKKRAIIKRAVDLYRIRGTKRGLALFLHLFTGHEPEIEENKWPFKGFRVGGTEDARIAFDSVILPPVDLANCFMVTMPMKFTDVTPEMVIRIHKIITMEKPAHSNYYLQFAADTGETQLREFFSIGLRSGIGIEAEIVDPEALARMEEEAKRDAKAAAGRAKAEELAERRARERDLAKPEPKADTTPEPSKPEPKLAPEPNEPEPKPEAKPEPADKPKSKIKTKRSKATKADKASDKDDDEATKPTKKKDK